MAVYVVLLRGVNVGGNNKLPMAQLRASLEAAGFDNVRTYIQSGNVVVESAKAKPASIAARIRAVIAGDFGLDIATMVVDAESFAKVVRANPFTAEPDPRRVHVFFLPEPLDEAAATRLGELQSAANAKGSRDTMSVVGTVMYLHTPDGFGNSDLAKALSTKGLGGHRAGTARNWATVTKLLEMTGA